MVSPHNGETKKRIKARKLIRQLAESIWACGDPGVQFSDTINEWHTVPNAGKIEASNPCSEFLFINNSSCDLASINLIKFYNADKKEFRLSSLRDLVRAIIESQDKLIDISSFPTKEIERNTRLYRPLGLGMTNLGALLMVMGLPYDSNEARLLAASLMSLITGWGYEKSAELAEDKSKPFKRTTHYGSWDFGGESTGHTISYEKRIGSYMQENKEPAESTWKIIGKHAGAMNALANRMELEIAWMEGNWLELYLSIRRVGLALGTITSGKQSVRNAQISALAPCGTISFLMDASTTGIEPAYSLVYEKELAFENKRLYISLPCISDALLLLSYGSGQVRSILNKLTIRRSLKGLIKDSDLPIFATAADPKGNQLSPDAHLLMLGALQPFVSGGISKTVNLPSNSSVEEIEEMIIKTHELGIKSVAFYRDGSKGAQVLKSGKDEEGICWSCGSKMIQSGTCFTCPDCGEGGVCS